MSHSLILGMTGSGKSSLAKKLAISFEAKDMRVAVLDPLGYDWPVTFHTDDPDGYMQYVRSHTRMVLFVDESGEVLKQHDKEKQWLATQSRHFGHSVFFIGQRNIQIPRTMRDQCETFYIFTLNIKDARNLADETNKPEIVGVADLPKMTFARVNRFEPVTYHTIKYRRGIPEVKNVGREVNPQNRSGKSE